MLQTAVYTSLYIDWKQTREAEGMGWSSMDGYSARNGGRREANIFLGPTPSRGAINRYMLGVAALSTVASIKLPKVPRRVVQSLILVVEVAAIQRNHQLGLKITF